MKHKTFDSVEKVEIGKVSVSIINNGNNAPSLVISIPGQETKTITLQGS